MRFFKYLVVLFASIFSINVYADYWKYNNYTSGSATSLCSSLVSITEFSPSAPFSHIDVKINPATPNNATCYHYNKNQTLTQLYTLTLVKEVCQLDKREDFKWWIDRDLPGAVCLRKCEYVKKAGEGQGCVDVDIEGVPGFGICGPVYGTGKECDKPDPDPKNQPKPPPPCKNSNGSDAYCDKPPEGCGQGYKEAMFNNKKICVKDSDNTPNPNDPNNNTNPPDPENPNACTKSYCPKPDDNKSCPDGYYSTTHNGSKICVKNNPNNPNNPNDPKGNPNDPNNNNGGDGSGNNGGDGGDGGAFCDGIGKALCDSIIDIKDFLTKEGDTSELEETTPTRELDLGQIQTDLFKASGQCPAPYTFRAPVVNHTFTVDISKLCDVLEIIGIFISIAAMIHGIAILVENS
ncbi:hypothetical protein F966_03336 [Acinetobacter higginsii]|uniref:Uncharacterized protein n=1 Tax=Acinetobacter higginsii TaxID=70347 RepID=N8XLF9_9GAMM|nr:virulence factor TspB C-terminal domain-related protein [Acinetobacter higginsii]ENV08273.1 hypothetical protein F966_03336 [Acinetobacter higginsii]